MSEKLLSIRPESQRTAETSKEKSSTAWFSIKRLQRLVIVGPVGIVSDHEKFALTLLLMSTHFPARSRIQFCDLENPIHIPPRVGRALVFFPGPGGGRKLALIYLRVLSVSQSLFLRWL